MSAGVGKARSFRRGGMGAPSHDTGVSASSLRVRTPRREVGYMRTGVGSHGGTGARRRPGCLRRRGAGPTGGQTLPSESTMCGVLRTHPLISQGCVCAVRPQRALLMNSSNSIEVMRPEDRQSVILCIAEVVNCDVPDQPSAYSADRSADGSSMRLFLKISVARAICAANSDSDYLGGAT